MQNCRHCKSCYIVRYFRHLDLGEGCEDGEAALHGHGDGGVDRARQADVDQGQQVGHQPREQRLLRQGQYSDLFAIKGGDNYLVVVTHNGQAIEHDGKDFKQQIEKGLNSFMHFMS